MKPAIVPLSCPARDVRGGMLVAWLAFTSLPALAVDYEKDIKPLLKERCYTCHGALKQKADLRLDTTAAMRKGGDGGDILAGEHALLLERVTTTDKDDRMPPEGEGSMLTTEQVAKLKDWIAAGAPAPANEQPEADPRAHWAYQPPKSSGKSMDALLSARLAAKHLKPQPEAAPEIWLRRVYLDLIGLPPTPEEIATFLKDTSMPARQRVVDHLLGTPQYGERWARHFMDIWRYCDWYGLGAQLRYSQKHIWHWRDWIVESLNADKGYDQMIVQMLAADELAPEDRDNLRATGFLARSYYLFNRTTWLDATIEHTCRAFLGVTMQCVKCHDHKYDPIEQADYYRMRAIFEPLHVRLDPWQGETDFEKNGLPRVFDLHLDAPTYRHVRGDEKNEDKSKAMTSGIPQVLEFAAFQPKPVKLPPSAARPVLLSFVLEDQLHAAERDIAVARKALDQARQALAQSPQPAKDQTSAARVIVSDDFTSAKPAQWEIIKGDWKYSASGVRQHETGAERRVMRLKSAPPADFEASLSFTIRGGQKWKSVGIVFDSTDSDDVMVYMSAVNGGSKIQVAIGSDGKSSYPPAGAVSRAISQDVRYTLDLRVRGQLINASINGEPVLAYRLPQGRHEGALALSAFDADVEFHSFKLAELAVDVVMREPLADKSIPLADAKAAVTLAEKKLAAAAAKPAMIRAVFAAEKSKQDKALAKTAAAADAKFKLAQAEVDLAKAEADPKAKDAAKKIKAAREALEKAKKKVEAPGDTYTSLPASLKAQEGPEESTNAAVQTYPDSSTGRRLAFARWVADKRNPLTARVLVNQVWMRHFGAPIVANVDDFGRRSPAPPHQDILDSLTVDFMNNGWSLKHLHRAMVLSEVYRRSSSNAEADPATLAADPDNASYWRMNPRRMESQLVRDSLLHLAGKLDLTQGGPSIDPVKAETSPRRSLYFVQNANEEHRFLATFDNSNVLECYRRNESVVPQQALALTNSKISRECADALAAKLGGLDGDAFVTQSFFTVLGRPPTESERQASLEGFAALKQNRSLFLQALLNHNDFVTLR
ncbi:PSD1 and planctomycete cytochrome C domain-containing protein [Prosthecobacter sp.]|uniref:PSD1 and planctomycete cytochrome C domain-containing protein n=1 Tax=Prosthecobacter sp. TaxID=1965333 RepID=UPI001DC57D6E|nr:PSD1 and planctomycete cytochrome C domain-containing protein [Prosthecobacter sp.]MCB1279289.1 PSD1 domain-containing protein [Prosthecobacter sp.]